MSNANIREFADQLSDVFMRIEDAKVEAKSIIEAAKEAGVNTKALTKVARELVTESAKLAKKYADEEQLDMFRAQIGIFGRKGLDTTDKASSSARKAMQQEADKSLRELDKMLGSNIAGDQAELMAKVNKYTARKAAE